MASNLKRAAAARRPQRRVKPSNEGGADEPPMPVPSSFSRLLFSPLGDRAATSSAVSSHFSAPPPAAGGPQQQQQQLRRLVDDHEPPSEVFAHRMGCGWHSSLSVADDPPPLLEPTGTTRRRRRAAPMPPPRFQILLLQTMAIIMLQR